MSATAQSGAPFLDGRVVRAHGFVYYVETDGALWECRPRGRFKLQEEDRPAVLAGDRVRVRPIGAGEAVIEEVLPRRSELERPPVANVDQAVIVFTLAQPELDRRLLDRFLAVAESRDLTVLLVLNKIDLVTAEAVAAAAAPYRQIGYEVFPACARTGVGVDALKERLAERFSVLAGQSGVGKSRLLNALHPGLNLRTGDVSAKLQRGRHTTRHVELLRIEGVPGAVIADTPGFSLLQIEGVPATGLQYCFREFHRLFPACRFSGCLHRAEPGCAVKAAVAQGAIDAGRYDSYLAFLGEIEALPRY